MIEVKWCKVFEAKVLDVPNAPYMSENEKQILMHHLKKGIKDNGYIFSGERHVYGVVPVFFEGGKPIAKYVVDGDMWARLMHSMWNGEYEEELLICNMRSEQNWPKSVPQKWP